MEGERSEKKRKGIKRDGGQESLERSKEREEQEKKNRRSIGV